MMRVLVSLVCAPLFAMLLACSSDSNSNDDDPCRATGKRICERACACGNGTACKTGYMTSFGRPTLFEWSDQGDCSAGYAGSRCAGDGPKGVDFNACGAAIEAASCTDDAFVVPSECEEAKTDGG